MKRKKSISKINASKIKLVYIKLLIAIIVTTNSCNDINNNNSSHEKKSTIYYEKQLLFLDGDEQSYQFITETGKTINFIKDFNTEYLLTIESEGKYYPNKKLLNKRFLVKYHYDSYNIRLIKGINDSIMYIDSLKLIDNILNYNDYKPAEYLIAPSCEDEEVESLILNRFYNSIATKGEEFDFFSNCKDLVTDANTLKAECEITMRTNYRLYIFHFIVKKEATGELRLLSFTKKE